MPGAFSEAVVGELVTAEEAFATALNGHKDHIARCEEALRKIVEGSEDVQIEGRVEALRIIAEGRGWVDKSSTPPLRVQTPGDTINRLARCGDAGERFATLGREDCVALMALWTAACVMASRGAASPGLREAVATLAGVTS